MTNLEKIKDIFAGYSDDKFKKEFPVIVLNEYSRMKIGSCLGFIVGISLENKERAEYFANNFIRVFSHPYICNTKKVKINNREVYESVCCLHDDGTALSFRFSTYQHLTDEERIKTGARIKSVEGIPYLFRLAGGIIFHGLQQQFSVTLDSSLGWQIHT